MTANEGLDILKFWSPGRKDTHSVDLFLSSSMSLLVLHLYEWRHLYYVAVDWEEDNAQKSPMPIILSYLVRLRGQKGIDKARGPDGRVRVSTQQQKM